MVNEMYPPDEMVSHTGISYSGKIQILTAADVSDMG
jgi:hypothetical protein